MGAGADGLPYHAGSGKRKKGKGKYYDPNFYRQKKLSTTKLVAITLGILSLVAILASILTYFYCPDDFPRLANYLPAQYQEQGEYVDDKIDEYTPEFEDGDPDGCEKKCFWCCCCCCCCNLCLLPQWMLTANVCMNLNCPTTRCLSETQCCRYRLLNKTIELFLILRGLARSVANKDLDAMDKFWNQLSLENWVTLKIIMYYPSCNFRGDAQMMSMILQMADTGGRMAQMYGMMAGSGAMVTPGKATTGSNSVSVR